jgi:hypothetical protein
MTWILALWYVFLATLIVLSLTEILRTKFRLGSRYALLTTRDRTISFPVWPNWFNQFFLPATDSWYFVHFYDDSDQGAFQGKGVRVHFRNFGIFHVYALYLSPGNASFLLRSKLAELVPVKEKIVGGDSPSESDLLDIEATPDLDVKAFPSIQFRHMFGGRYIARSKDLTAAATLLSKCPAVYAITPIGHMRPSSPVEDWRPEGVNDVTG